VRVCVSYSVVEENLCDVIIFSVDLSAIVTRVRALHTKHATVPANSIFPSKVWRFGVVVVRWFRSTRLTYAEPG